MKRFLSMLVCMSMIFTLIVFVPATASAEVTYSGPQSIYYNDFKTNTNGVTGVFITTGLNQGNGTMTLNSTKDNGYLTVDTTAGANIRVTATSADQSVKKFVMEYAIRQGTKTGLYMYSQMGGGSYGIPNVGIYRGKVTAFAYNTALDINDTSVTNDAWTKITIVLDSDYVNSDGTEYTSGDRYVKRAIYVDGELKHTEYTEANYQLQFLTTDNEDMMMKFVTNGAYDYDLDYVKYYAAANTFAAKLPVESGIAVSDIDVWFNNIPVKADLSSKIEVVNASGTKVAGVESVSINNDVDPGTDYAQSVNLAFDTELDPGTSYKLKFNDVTDFAGNTLNTELTFTTKAGNKEYVAPQSIYYQDFEDIAAETIASWTANSTIPGFYMTKQENTAAVVSDSVESSKYFKLTGIVNKTSVFQIYNSSATMPDNPDKYIVEYKIKPTNIYGSGSAVYGTYGSSYGLPTLGLYQNNFNTDTINSATAVGRYESSKWYTIHIVYDGEVDSSGNTVRDIYINGVLEGEDISQAGKNANFMTSGTGNMVTTLAYLGRADGSLEVDYIKYYASADTFTVDVETDNVFADNGIEVKFNNIPDVDSLIANAVILDASGNEVCGISDVTYNNNFNPGESYAQSITLNFEKALAKNTTYTLQLSGVQDISGNTVSHTESFTTNGSDSFAYGSFSFADNNETVSINITKNISEAKDYTLIIAGYDEYNGGIKMVSVAEKKISTVSGTNTYTSNEIDVTDCAYVKAFLWDGMKPVITQRTKTITQ